MAVHNAFPGITRTASGAFVIVYRAAPDHGPATGANRGIIASRSSADSDGCSWGAEASVFDDGTLDSRDPAARRLSDGTIIVSFFKHDGTNGGPVFTIRSSDDGASWDTPVAVGSTLVTDEFCSAPVVELDNGDLLLPIYGRDAGDTNERCVLMQSTDGGDTWAELANLADGDADGRRYQEPNVLLLDNGNLLCVFRTQGGTHYSATSSDSGATWTSPASTGIAGSGRPALGQATNGAVVLVYRSGEDVAYRTSWDRGSTWTPASSIDSAPSGGQMVYAQMVEAGSNELAAAYATENSGQTSADASFTYLHPREVSDPLASCA